MAPITIRVIDSNGRGLQGLHATLHCRCLYSGVERAVDFNSLTDAEGKVVLWFRHTGDLTEPYHFPVLAGAGAGLTLQSSINSTCSVVFQGQLSLLSYGLPTVVIQLGQKVALHYMSREAAGPAERPYQQRPTSPISPLELPPPVNRRKTVGPTLRRSKRALDDNLPEHSAKRARKS